MAVDIEKARAMLDHWESYAEAPWRYSSTTALMARETRDTIAALLDERDALAREVDACAAALPGPYYMDPPDGGDVPISEQVKRMARDAATLRSVKDLVADGLDLSHSIMTGCRCMSCYTYQFIDVDDKVVGEADHIEDAVRKAQAAMKGASDES